METPQGKVLYTKPRAEKRLDGKRGENEQFRAMALTHPDSRRLSQVARRQRLLPKTRRSIQCVRQSATTRPPQSYIHESGRI